MKTKTFEVRDKATFIPILAIRIEPDDTAQGYLLRRAGYADSKQILLVRIAGGSGLSTCDPYDWGNRTMTTAHEYIRKNFDTLEDGDVIDVEYILGETTKKKRSERFDYEGDQ